MHCSDILCTPLYFTTLFCPYLALMDAITYANTILYQTVSRQALISGVSCMGSADRVLVAASNAPHCLLRILVRPCLYRTKSSESGTYSTIS